MKDGVNMSTGRGGGFSGAGGFGPRRVENPYRGNFMPIAHCLWTLLIGYVGMKYALFINARREKQATADSNVAD